MQGDVVEGEKSKTLSRFRAVLYGALAVSSWSCLKRSPCVPWADGSFHIMVSYSVLQMYKNLWNNDPSLQIDQIDFYLEHKRSAILTGEIAFAWKTLQPKFNIMLSYLSSVPPIADWFGITNWESWLDDAILFLDILALGCISHYALPKYDKRWPWFTAMGFFANRYMLPHLAEYFGVDQEDGKAFGYILTNYLAANALVGQMMLNKPP